MPVSQSSAFVLNQRSIIMCPHGGMVRHVPAGTTSYRVDGALPLLYGDVIIVAGCSFSTGFAYSSCQSVQWHSPSSLLIVKGRPPLISTSIGLCLGGMGGVPAIITANQSMQREPSELTMIND